MHTFLDNGSVTSPKGFRAAAVASGIKVGRDDMALLVSDTPATAAALFTSNKVAAAPVILDRQKVESEGIVQAILVNAGCANACTGPEGMADARESAELVAASLGIRETHVLVASTGVIGRRLPMDRIREGIRMAVPALSRDGGEAASRAILTTDTHEKRCAVQLEIQGKTVTVGGMCKGAGMIEPNLATMLAFVTTDAAVASPELLRAVLKKAADQSFNRVTVDGDQSTNDSLFVLANGASGIEPLGPSSRDWPAFVDALSAVCLYLAKQIAGDGEGSTKFITVRVLGAASSREALLAAKTIANSPLVKTAWFGGDPNWGRIISAVGDSGIEIDPLKAVIAFDNEVVYDSGKIADEASLKRLEEVVSHKTFAVTVDLKLGPGDETVYTCDLSYEYVKINGEYTT